MSIRKSAPADGHTALPGTRGAGGDGSENPDTEASREDRKGRRGYGKRVYDEVIAINIWRRIDEHNPSGAEEHAVGFGDETIDLAKLGRGISQKSVDISPAAGYNKWRSYKRTRDRLRCQDASLGPLYQAYYIARDEYREMWSTTMKILPGTRRESVGGGGETSKNRRGNERAKVRLLRRRSGISLEKELPSAPVYGRGLTYLYMAD